MLDCEVTTLAQWVQVYFCKDQVRSRFERALLSGAHELTETLYRGIKDKIQYWYMCVCCESNIVVGLWRSKHVFHLLARKQLFLRRREGARKNKNKDQIRYLTRSLPSWVQFFPLLCNWNKYFSFWKRFFCNRSLEGFQEKHVPLLRNVTNLCRQSIKTRIKPVFISKICSKVSLLYTDRSLRSNPHKVLSHEATCCRDMPRAKIKSMTGRDRLRYVSIEFCRRDVSDWNSCDKSRHRIT